MVNFTQQGDNEYCIYAMNGQCTGLTSELTCKKYEIMYMLGMGIVPTAEFKY
jgi:hypothetical protein